jgi:hypothetical protein
MAKRGDRARPPEPTVPLTDSQLIPAPPKPPRLLPEKPKPKPRPHDVSVWKGTVVGSDEFAPAPKVRKSVSSRAIWIVVGLAAVAAAAGVYYVKFADGDSPASAAAPVAAPPAPTTPAPETAPADATPAAPVVAVVDAAPATDPVLAVGGIEVDAISGAAISTMKAQPKKKVGKKKKAMPKKKKKKSR